MTMLHKTLRLTALAVAMLAATGAQAAPELVTNGSFDSGLTGWVNGPSTFTPVVILAGGAYFDANDDLIRQSLSVVAGQAYTLTFDYSSTGTTGNGFQFDFNGAGYATTWQNLGATDGAVSNYSYSFVAASTGNTVLRFSGAGNKLAVLDNVSVTAVPEPETYAMMLAGLGAIGFMARRRQDKKA